MFLVFTCNTIPVYCVNSLDYKFSLIRNKTVFGLVVRDAHQHVETIFLLINNFFIPFGAFLIITVCTIILSCLLHRNAKWRAATIADSNVDNVSSRNQKIAKMVVLISTLYIACFIPTATIMLAIAFERALFFNGKYMNVSIMLGGISYVLEGINSSMNIFIYHRMSSKFRYTVHKMIIH